MPNKYKLDFINHTEKVFNLSLNNEENFIKAEIPQEIIEIAENRKIAKQNKDWASADNFRDKILELGYIIKDKPNNEYELIKK